MLKVLISKFLHNFTPHSYSIPENTLITAYARYIVSWTNKNCFQKTPLIKKLTWKFFRQFSCSVSSSRDKFKIQTWSLLNGMFTCLSVTWKYVIFYYRDKLQSRPYGKAESDDSVNQKYEYRFKSVELNRRLNRRQTRQFLYVRHGSYWPIAINEQIPNSSCADKSLQKLIRFVWTI